MDTATRTNLLREAPIQPSFLIRKLWGITAVCLIIGFFPVAAYTLILWAKLSPRIAVLTGWHVENTPPALVLVTVPFILCYVLPLTIGFRAASLYTLRLVKLYLDRAEPEKAEAIAEALSSKVWWWHGRQRPWFREFVVERELILPQEPPRKGFG